MTRAIVIPINIRGIETYQILSVKNRAKMPKMMQNIETLAAL
ncbi:hypothetical protein NITUZ_140021 [Candidatus Nitrosotenuis uzonensis]|uniref:Uncharacterized protein n=1 Tax=Candidatus Nitrosotenuis uzonensis TaxID=1407055 RepID=V6AQD4_9ARCH|nr:hypothetical protein NITUZ_140021 [Candidatus Nitrosotenuis uzonensis]